MNSYIKPNFLIVGAAKSGTSSLYQYLYEHPDIFLPELKEPLFFIKQTVSSFNKKNLAIKNENLINTLPKTHEEYYKLFEPTKENHAAIGEASATYLYFYQEAIPNIKKELGDPKIIIILRNPIQKTASHYKHLMRLGAEKMSLEAYIKNESFFIENNYPSLYHLTKQSYYYQQVKAYLDAFSNVKVILNDDLNQNPSTVINDIFNFLEVPEFYPNLNKRYNVSEFIPKNYNVQKFINRPAISKIRHILYSILGKRLTKYTKLKYHHINKQKINLSEELKEKLVNLYKPNIEKLEVLIGRNLETWKNI